MAQLYFNVPSDVKRRPSRFIKHPKAATKAFWNSTYNIVLLTSLVMLSRRRANHDGSTSWVGPGVPKSLRSQADDIEYHLRRLVKVMEAVDVEFLRLFQAVIVLESEGIIRGPGASTAETALTHRERDLASFQQLIQAVDDSGHEEAPLESIISRLRDTRCIKYWTIVLSYKWNSPTQLQNAVNRWSDAVSILREISPSLLGSSSTRFPKDLHQSIWIKVQTLEPAVGQLVEISPEVGLEIPQDEYVSRNLKAKAKRAAEMHQEKIMGSPENLAQLVSIYFTSILLPC